MGQTTCGVESTPLTPTSQRCPLEQLTSVDMAAISRKRLPGCVQIAAKQAVESENTRIVPGRFDLLLESDIGGLKLHPRVVVRVITRRQKTCRGKGIVRVYAEKPNALLFIV